MPARKPAHAAQRISMVREAPPVPTPERIAERAQMRQERVLHSGMMRRVAEAVIAAGDPVEIETETHIVTMTAAPK